LLGEESYAMYALHLTFLIIFGALGIPLVLLTAFLVEYATRRQQINERIRLAYGQSHGR
jgi:hypothetical protein